MICTSLSISITSDKWHLITFTFDHFTPTQFKYQQKLIPVFRVFTGMLHSIDNANTRAPGDLNSTTHLGRGRARGRARGRQALDTRQMPPCRRSSIYKRNRDAPEGPEDG